MLDDLSKILDREKARDLVQRLESKKVEQALPAEMELAILWAIAGTGDIVVEPVWWGGGRRPDAVSETILAGIQVAVEIASATDNSISPEEAMDNVALRISDFCSRLVKGTGQCLFFRFRETSRRVEGRVFRHVLAPSEFELGEDLKCKLADWIKYEWYKTQRLVLDGPGLFVEVEFTGRRHSRYHNIWTSLPPTAYSLEQNPLFELLRRKADQLRGAAAGTVRIIVVADVGSTLLGRLGQVGEDDAGGRHFSARQIISRFVQQNDRKVEGVVALSPRNEFRMSSNERKWAIQSFSTEAGRGACQALVQVLETLPPPRFAGYQARSIFRQGLFSPKAKGWYLGVGTVAVRLDRNDPDSGWQTSLKIPARVLLDFLAGRITEKQFRYFLGERNGERNYIAAWLDSGLTISGAEMAPRNLDEEDDHIILHLTDDPAARPLATEDAT